MKPLMIFAPHADDEIIGCYKLLKVNQNPNNVVIYPTDKAIQEAEKSSILFGFKCDLLSNIKKYDLKEFTLHFPDPYFESHPLHREIGSMLYKFRRLGFRVNCYSVQMNAPYIEELHCSIEKRDVLNSCYPQKSDLWEYDHKYFLFEGHCFYF